MLTIDELNELKVTIETCIEKEEEYLKFLKDNLHELYDFSPTLTRMLVGDLASIIEKTVSGLV